MMMMYLITMIPWIQIQTDEDYIDVDWERGVSKLEPFRKVTKAIIRSGKLSDEDATRIINLTLGMVNHDVVCFWFFTFQEKSCQRIPRGF